MCRWLASRVNFERFSWTDTDVRSAFLRYLLLMTTDPRGREIGEQEQSKKNGARSERRLLCSTVCGVTQDSRASNLTTGLIRVNRGQRQRFDRVGP